MFDGNDTWERRYENMAHRQENWQGDSNRKWVRGPEGFHRKPTNGFRRQQWHRDRGGFQKRHTPNKGTGGQYPIWQIQQGREVLEYCASQPRFSMLLYTNHIAVKGQAASFDFAANPNWHGTVEDYAKSFLPYGGNSVICIDDCAEESAVSNGTLLNVRPTSDIPTINIDGSYDNPGPGTSGHAMHTNLSLPSYDNQFAILGSVKEYVEFVCDHSSSSSHESEPSVEEIQVIDLTGAETATPRLSSDVINKCDYCDYVSRDPDMMKHLREAGHYTASNYETSPGSKNVSFVTGMMRWRNDDSLNKKVSVVCPYCQYEIFEDVFQCATHCSVIHSKPNEFALSDVVWKGSLTLEKGFKCQVCHLSFKSLSKLNQHLRANVNHFPGDLWKFMNTENVLFFSCCTCITNSHDFFAMSNHVQSHSAQPFRFNVLVLKSMKKQCTLPPLKFPDQKGGLLWLLQKLLTNTKRRHGYNSQMVNKIKEQIEYMRRVL